MAGSRRGKGETAAGLPARRGETGLTARRGSIFFDVQAFQHARSMAAVFAASSMVPKHFQGQANTGNVMIALNLAQRLNVDPFMLMQSMGVVHGRPVLEGKLIITLINGTGRFEPLKFSHVNRGKLIADYDRGWRCRAYAKEKASGEVLEGPEVTWAMVEAEEWNRDRPMRDGSGVQKSKWNTMPELMFMYRAASFFGKTHCPEALMGMQTREEMEDAVVLEAGPDGVYETPPAEDPADLRAAFFMRCAQMGMPEGEGFDPAVMDAYMEKISGSLDLDLPETYRRALDGTATPEGWSRFEQSFRRFAAGGARTGEDAASSPAPPEDGSGQESPATAREEFLRALGRRRLQKAWAAFLDGAGIAPGSPEEDGLIAGAVERGLGESLAELAAWWAGSGTGDRKPPEQTGLFGHAGSRADVA